MGGSSLTHPEAEEEAEVPSLLGGVQVDADLQRLFSSSPVLCCSCLLGLLLLLLLFSLDSLSLLSLSWISPALAAFLVTSSMVILPLSKDSSVSGERSLAPCTCVYTAASAVGHGDCDPGATYGGLLCPSSPSSASSSSISASSFVS